jgi:hypothetical protein
MPNSFRPRDDQASPLTFDRTPLARANRQNDTRKAHLSARRALGVVVAAGALTAAQRAAIAEWSAKALTSDRSLAVQAIWSRAREVGREPQVLRVMDEAFRAAVESAGAQPYGYFADDRGPAPAWDAAARLAAEAAAAEAAADLIAPEMYELLVGPWTTLSST